MIDTCQIKPQMPVVSSNNGQVATVDHLDADNSIKLTKDESGQHYWIAVDRSHESTNTSTSTGPASKPCRSGIPTFPISDQDNI